MGKLSQKTEERATILYIAGETHISTGPFSIAMSAMLNYQRVIPFPWKNRRALEKLSHVRGKSGRHLAEKMIRSILVPTYHNDPEAK